MFACDQDLIKLDLSQLSRTKSHLIWFVFVSRRVRVYVYVCVLVSLIECETQFVLAFIVFVIAFGLTRSNTNVDTHTYMNILHVDCTLA